MYQAEQRVLCVLYRLTSNVTVIITGGSAQVMNLFQMSEVFSLVIQQESVRTLGVVLACPNSK